MSGKREAPEKDSHQNRKKKKKKSLGGVNDPGR